MPEHRFRVLAIATHPVQYQAPLFRRMAQSPQLDLQVAYLSLRGAEPVLDPDFAATVQWDIPLLDGYRWTHISGHRSAAAAPSERLNSSLSALIRDGKFDAVLCYLSYVRGSFWEALLAAKRSKIAFLFGTDATTLAARNGRLWKAALKKMVWPHIFRLADQVIVPSSGTRDLLVSLGISAERVTLTPYCVDNDWWMHQAEQADRAAVRAAWGVSAAGAAILFCAKLQPWKRPQDLLRAFAQSSLTNAHLIFAGDGPLRTQLEAESTALGVGGRVHFLGFVNQSQLPSLYKSADVMVLPSDYEPFAVVVNEAMCCGCPVIASDRVGAARDLVAPVAPEFVFPCGDVSALTAVLARAFANRTRLAEVASRSIAHIQTWSPERNLAMTVEAISLAVSRAAPRKPGGKETPAMPEPPVIAGRRS